MATAAPNTEVLLQGDQLEQSSGMIERMWRREIYLHLCVLVLTQSLPLRMERRKTWCGGGWPAADRRQVGSHCVGLAYLLTLTKQLQSAVNVVTGYCWYDLATYGRVFLVDLPSSIYPCVFADSCS